MAPKKSKKQNKGKQTKYIRLPNIHFGHDVLASNMCFFFWSSGVLSSKSIRKRNQKKPITAEIRKVVDWEEKEEINGNASVIKTEMYFRVYWCNSKHNKCFFFGRSTENRKQRLSKLWSLVGT